VRQVYVTELSLAKKWMNLLCPKAAHTKLFFHKKMGKWKHSNFWFTKVVLLSALCKVFSSGFCYGFSLLIKFPVNFLLSWLIIQSLALFKSIIVVLFFTGHKHLMASAVQMTRKTQWQNTFMIRFLSFTCWNI